ncbi:MAG TPA: CAP domain-containing protein [Allosphingosinicella sp.]|nr:CAP domain-containing protein [Allosphingosinicella sp.]
MRHHAIAILACTAAAISSPAAGQPRAPGIESLIIVEINRARADPAAYAEELRRYRALFDGLVLRMPGSEIGLRTREGVAAVDDAIRFLTAQTPRPALAEAPLLASAAAEHVADQGPRGLEGHVGTDGKNSRDRIRRQGGGARAATAEVIAYGRIDAAAVVRQLIVDDGVAGRGHRAILFSSYRSAGAACGDHAVHRHVCVVDFSASADGR